MALSSLGLSTVLLLCYLSKCVHLQGMDLSPVANTFYPAAISQPQGGNCSSYRQFNTSCYSGDYRAYFKLQDNPAAISPQAVANSYYLFMLNIIRSAGSKKWCNSGNDNGNNDNDNGNGNGNGKGNGNGNGNGNGKGNGKKGQNGYGNMLNRFVRAIPYSCLSDVSSTTLTTNFNTFCSKSVWLSASMINTQRNCVANVNSDTTAFNMNYIGNVAPIAATKFCTSTNAYQHCTNMNIDTCMKGSTLNNLMSSLVGIWTNRFKQNDNDNKRAPPVSSTQMQSSQCAVARGMINSIIFGYKGDNNQGCNNNTFACLMDIFQMFLPPNVTQVCNLNNMMMPNMMPFNARDQSRITYQIYGIGHIRIVNGTVPSNQTCGFSSASATLLSNANFSLAVSFASVDLFGYTFYYLNGANLTYTDQDGNIIDSYTISDLTKSLATTFDSGNSSITVSSQPNSNAVRISSKSDGGVVIEDKNFGLYLRFRIVTYGTKQFLFITARIPFGLLQYGTGVFVEGCNAPVDTSTVISSSTSRRKRAVSCLSTDATLDAQATGSQDACNVGDLASTEGDVALQQDSTYNGAVKHFSIVFIMVTLLSGLAVNWM